MPYIENLEELVDDLADLIGIYGSHDDLGPDCPDDPRKQCRVCFSAAMADRIRDVMSRESEGKGK